MGLLSLEEDSTHVLVWRQREKRVGTWRFRQCDPATWGLGEKEELWLGDFETMLTPHHPVSTSLGLQTSRPQITQLPNHMASIHL